MLAILSSLNAHNFPIFQPILMILVSKYMVHRALSDKWNLTYRRVAVPFKGNYFREQILSFKRNPNFEKGHD